MKSNIVSSCCQANVLFTLSIYDLPEKSYCSNCHKPCSVAILDPHGKPNQKDYEELFDDQNDTDKKD
jgi:hypothetical protein